MEVRTSDRLLRTGAGVCGAVLLLAWGAIDPTVARGEPGQQAKAEGKEPDHSAPLQLIAEAEEGPSVAEFSARRPAQVRRLLLAQARSEHDAARAAAALVPFLPAPAQQLESATARMRSPAPAQLQAASPAVSGTPAPVEPSTLGRPLSAQAPPDAEEFDARPRRRAAFQTAMQRAAANSALALRDDQSSFQSGMSPRRYSPSSSRSAGDPFGAGLQEAADAVSLVPGLSISTASLSAGYSSNAIPQRGLRSGGLGGPLGSDYDLGAQATFSYVNQGRKSALTMDYTPSHVQRARFDEWTTTNHALSIGATRQMGAKWTLGAEANGGYNGLEQYWLELPILTFPDYAPESLDDLYAAAEAGQITDEEFASLLTGAPVVEDPGGRVLAQSRVLSYQGSLSASYAYSPRTSVSFRGGMRRSNLTNDLERPSNSVGGLFALRNTQGRFASASVSHRLSPRTTIGVSQSVNQMESDFVDSTNYNTMATVRQRLTRELQYRAGFGFGVFDRGSQAALSGVASDGTFRGATWAASGGMDYAKGSHVVSFDASRRAGDNLGLGSQTSTQAMAQWQWVNPRSQWIANAGLGIMRLSNGNQAFIARPLNSDLYLAGLGRRWSASTLVRTDYYYGVYESPFQGLFSSTEIHRVQISLVWRPAERR